MALDFGWGQHTREVPLKASMCTTSRKQRKGWHLTVPFEQTPSVPLPSKGPQYLLGKPLDDWAHGRHIQTIADTAVFMSMGLPAKQWSPHLLQHKVSLCIHVSASSVEWAAGTDSGMAFGYLDSLKHRRQEELAGEGVRPWPRSSVFLREGYASVIVHIRYQKGLWLQCNGPLEQWFWILTFEAELMNHQMTFSFTVKCALQGGRGENKNHTEILGRNTNLSHTRGTFVLGTLRL